jgi:hypothetical protein
MCGATGLWDLHCAMERNWVRFADATPMQARGSPSRREFDELLPSALAEAMYVDIQGMLKLDTWIWDETTLTLVPPELYARGPPPPPVPMARLLEVLEEMGPEMVLQAVEAIRAGPTTDSPVAPSVMLAVYAGARKVRWGAPRGHVVAAHPPRA